MRASMRFGIVAIAWLTLTAVPAGAQVLDLGDPPLEWKTGEAGVRKTDPADQPPSAGGATAGGSIVQPGYLTGSSFLPFNADGTPASAAGTPTDPASGAPVTVPAGTLTSIPGSGFIPGAVGGSPYQEGRVPSQVGTVPYAPESLPSSVRPSGTSTQQVPTGAATTPTGAGTGAGAGTNPGTGTGTNPGTGTSAGAAATPAPGTAAGSATSATVGAGAALPGTR